MSKLFLSTLNLTHSFLKGIVASASDNGRIFTMRAHLPPPPEGSIPDNHVGNVLSVYSRTTPEYSATFVSEPLNVSCELLLLQSDLVFLFRIVRQISQVLNIFRKCKAGDSCGNIQASRPFCT